MGEIVTIELPLWAIIVLFVLLVISQGLSAYSCKLRDRLWRMGDDRSREAARKSKENA